MQNSVYTEFRNALRNSEMRNSVYTEFRNAEFRIMNSVKKNSAGIFFDGIMDTLAGGLRGQGAKSYKDKRCCKVEGAGG